MWDERNNDGLATEPRVGCNGKEPATSVCLAARQESGQSGLPFLFRFVFSRCVVYRTQQAHNIGAVLVTHFERSVEVLGYPHVLKLSIVSLDLHREQGIIPRDVINP